MTADALLKAGLAGVGTLAGVVELAGGGVERGRWPGESAAEGARNGCLWIPEVREGGRILAQKLLGFVADILGGHTQEGHPAAVLARQSLQIGVLLPARGAPGGPLVHDYRAATQPA